MKQALDIQGRQSLLMTPQLQQAIKLLQMTGQDLEIYIEEELLTNPLLSRDEDAEDESEEGKENLSEVDFSSDEPLNFENQLPFDETFYEGEEKTTRGEAFSLESLPAAQMSLRDFLSGQIKVEIFEQDKQEAAFLLVEHLDEAGYFRGDLAQIAQSYSLSLKEIEDILLKLQNLEPTGIFARNLEECLRLQLYEKGLLTPVMEKLLLNLPLLGAGQIEKLLKILSISREELKKCISEIKALNPKPASAFEDFLVETVVPDIFVVPDGKRGWRVELNSARLPKVLVHEVYYQQVKSSARSREEKKYLTERYQSANWLVKALHQRATTLLKVASEIITQQEAFLTRGVKFLRPLILKDIAEVIEMHESTVSRVTTNKFIQTPRGTFELKYFFSSALQGAHKGERHAAEFVKARIKQLIMAENVQKPLSDDDLVDILVKEDIHIARRTVAKYREALKIPSSFQRRYSKSQLI